MKKIFLIVIALVTFLTTTAFAAEDSFYDYKSARFGFSIKCPFEPLAVVVNPFPETEKRGELLVFEAGEGIKVKHGYIIELDAFNTNTIPDFNNDSEKIIDAYIDGQKKTNSFAVVDLANISKDNKGVLMVSAKEIQIDEDGDGNFDGVAVADTQTAVTYFRTPNSGRCIAVQLIADEITEDWLKAYQFSVASFKDATEMIGTPDASNKKADKKSGKKVKKEKTKKEKKSKK